MGNDEEIIYFLANFINFTVPLRIVLSSVFRENDPNAGVYFFGLSLNEVTFSRRFLFYLRKIFQLLGKNGRKRTSSSKRKP